MIALIQRVLEASVTVDSQLIDGIGSGLLVLLGVKGSDDSEEASYLASKTVNLRIFSDKENKMNLSLLDTGYEILVVSQFTLHADTRHGNRPSFTNSAEAELAKELYESYIFNLRQLIGYHKVHTGKFGAMMKVKLINDGPVTIILKSKNEYF
ncbi:MAG: D-aminoacyl-tRNA deacylase [Ignavibacteria bacterium]|nr:D-aminoacyl-tRNA deacylase [Ignavibacteria bacterium]